MTKTKLFFRTFLKELFWINGFGYVKDWPKAVTYSIHNLVSKIGNFGLKFVHFVGFLILDGVSYRIQNQSFKIGHYG